MMIWMHHDLWLDRRGHGWGRRRLDPIFPVLIRCSCHISSTQVVLVTGGGTGIGRMIAEGFVANGAKVYIASR